MVPNPTGLLHRSLTRQMMVIWALFLFISAELEKPRSQLTHQGSLQGESPPSLCLEHKKMEQGADGDIGNTTNRSPKSFTQTQYSFACS